jgi:tellurite resistance protein
MASGDEFSKDGEGARAALRSRIDTGAIKLSGLAAIFATDDREVLDRLTMLGFTPDSARVLDVLPLVHVAWADGKIQAAERKAVLAVLESRNIPRSSDAWLLIETLLETRPSETYLAQSLQLLRLLGRSSGADPKSVVDLCTVVAEASGTLFGIGAKVTPAERQLIARIAAALGSDAEGSVMERVSPPPRA